MATSQHYIANLTAYALYTVKRAAATFIQKVATSGGVITFPSTTGATFNVDRQDTYTVPADFHTKYAAIIAPVPGETMLAPADVRLIAAGGDYNNLSPATVNEIQWFNGDTPLSVSGSDQYRSIFRARTTLAAGTHRLWCRVTYSDGATTDSKPHTITVVAAPAYGATITLTGNTAWNAAALGSGTLSGTGGSKIKIDAAGFVINGTASANLSWTHVDVFNLGATSGQTLTKGLDITVTGNLTWNTVRFYQCGSMEATVNNGTAQTVTITDCLFASNSRVPIGSTSYYSSGGSTLASDSLACLVVDGTASGAKVFKGNTVGAAPVILNCSSWTVGGATAADENIFMGPRIGLYLSPNQTSSSFTGTVKRNFAYQIYYGEWSEGSNFELHGVSTANGTVEHNVIMGSSWPVRGIACEFRYNLVLGDVWHHEGCWFGPTNGNCHHNVIRTSDVSAGRGGLYNVVSASPTVRNNTLDGVNNSGGGSMFVSPGGTPVFNSNAVIRSDSFAVTISGGSLTANYNGFNANDSNGYSHQGLQANDTTAAPAFAAVPTVFCPFDLAAVWNRTKTVASVLADYRTYYKPTNVAYDAGDTSVYGANNPIGAICRAGVSNSNDLFGTLS